MGCIAQGSLCIWLIILSCLASTILCSDRQILKDLSEQLKGSGGSFWNTSNSDPCNWQGVYCNADSVTNITLQSIHLTGIIPAVIGSLRALTVLDLSRNSLSGQIPANLSDCQNLAVLDLAGNSLFGPIPADLHKLSRLEVLDLSMNSLNGTIPEGLGNLSSLWSLSLSLNNLTGTIPPGLGNLKALQVLSISQNSLHGSIPHVIGNLSNLQSFSAYQNSLSGSIPEFNQKNLQWLNLASNFLTGELPSNLCASGQLEGLILTNNRLNGTLPAVLGNCSTLLKLRVGSNMFHGRIPADIGKLENLVYFAAEQNQLTGGIPTSLSGWKNLSLLNLAGNLLTGTIPDELGDVSSIQELHLSSNNLTGEIPGALSRCKLLSVLDLSENNLIGQLPDDLCSIRKLSSLRLQGNSLTGQIPASIGDCEDLLELQLGQNGFTGRIPSTLGNLSNLQVSLNLSFNQLTGSIPEAIGKLSKLNVLDLSHNKLSGGIPSMKDMASLLYWNFSYNMLSGPVPQVGSFSNTSSSSYVDSYSHNSGLCGGPLPPCNNDAYETRQRPVSFLQSVGIAVIGGVVVVLVFMGIMSALMYSHNHVSSVVDPAPSSTVSHVFEENLEQAVNFDSIKEATESKVNVISSNHFSTMYKAVMPSGLVLAAKRFHSTEKGPVFQQKKLISELDRLWRLSHENIMQPIGYLLQDNLAIVLYDFVPVCSLGQQLHKNLESSMMWSARYDIAVGAAQGLAFLHSCHPSMVHMDVNSSNIFLGHHSEIKVGDIEVHKLLDPSKNTGSISAVAGSFGYIAPEYAFTMQVTLASNIYSFGVVLLELVTGRLPVDESFGDGLDLVRWVHGASSRSETPEQILDARISTKSFAVRQEMLAVLKVALLCTDVSPLNRPKMRKVVELLLEAKRPAETQSYTD